MDIETDKLIIWGGTFKEYAKKEILFREGTVATYYYQIVTGKIAMYNIDKDGKEYLQGSFSDGDSFGEPPLFIDEKYPSTAMAITESVVVRVSKRNFLEMLTNDTELQFHFLQVFAKRIYVKSSSALSLVTNNAEFRLLNFLSTWRLQGKERTGRVMIPLTRQEIANATGLRVETVIRTLAKMAEHKQVEIINHKLYY